MHDYVNLPRLKSDKNQALTQRRHATKAPLALAPFPLMELGWMDYYGRPSGNWIISYSPEGRAQ